MNLVYTHFSYLLFLFSSTSAKVTQRKEHLCEYAEDEDKDDEDNDEYDDPGLGPDGVQPVGGVQPVQPGAHTREAALSDGGRV